MEEQSQAIIIIITNNNNNNKFHTYSPVATIAKTKIEQKPSYNNNNDNNNFNIIRETIKTTIIMA